MNKDLEYKEFKKKNRIRVNRYLNIVLWCFVLTGPAIASGVAGGVFKDISYLTCFGISLVVVAMASIHLVLRIKVPEYTVTCLFALTALDLLLVYMNLSHVNIFLTWFLVPVLSLLFTDKFIFFYSVILNYILMAATTWIMAPYHLATSIEYDSVFAYYRDIMGGYTIESLVLVISAFMVGRLTENYYRELLDNYRTIRDHEEKATERMDILNSMVEIYDNVNLISFVDNTEMSLRDEKQEKHAIDMSTQTHTLMNQRLKHGVMPDQLDDFLKFTNIKTVRARLSQKKIISADFIDVVQGWFRAQYITVDATLDGIPNTVIYTTRNVDEEKRREEHLIRISLTDDMTRLYNRRCYDEDLKVFAENGIPDDLVLFSIDVNGLKTVNDTKGHAAGDELIKGAADCLSLSVGKHGKVYRTGGDEFMAIVHTDDPQSIRQAIWDKAGEWHGIYNESIAMSVGFASYSEKEGSTMADLEHLADADMYAEKERYYRENGIDRRR